MALTHDKECRCPDCRVRMMGEFAEADMHPDGKLAVIWALAQPDPDDDGTCLVRVPRDWAAGAGAVPLTPDDLQIASLMLEDEFSRAWEYVYGSSGDPSEFEDHCRVLDRFAGLLGVPRDFLDRGRARVREDAVPPEQLCLCPKCGGQASYNAVFPDAYCHECGQYVPKPTVLHRYGGHGVELDPTSIADGYCSVAYNNYVLVADPHGPWRTRWGQRATLASVHVNGEIRWTVYPHTPVLGEGAVEHYGLTPWKD